MYICVAKNGCKWKRQIKKTKNKAANLQIQNSFQLQRQIVVFDPLNLDFSRHHCTKLPSTHRHFTCKTLHFKGLQQLIWLCYCFCYYLQFPQQLWCKYQNDWTFFCRFMMKKNLRGQKLKIKCRKLFRRDGGCGSQWLAVVFYATPNFKKETPTYF